MKARPILFSGPMVCALLDGRKTQTRRVVKHPEYYGCPTGDCPHWQKTECNAAMQENAVPECPYGQPGDLLWVRETWAPCGTDNPDETIALFRATEPTGLGEITWKPSIHMPRWASRLTLEITAVRVGRLQDITADDCRAEGCVYVERPPLSVGYYPAYRDIWESINGRGSWSVNPWIFVLEFTVRRCNVDDYLKSLDSV